MKSLKNKKKWGICDFLWKYLYICTIFSVDGKKLPCTVIEEGPCVVTQVKTVEKTVTKLFNYINIYIEILKHQCTNKINNDNAKKNDPPTSIGENIL